MGNRGNGQGYWELNGARVYGDGSDGDDDDTKHKDIGREMSGNGG